MLSLSFILFCLFLPLSIVSGDDESPADSAPAVATETKAKKADQKENETAQADNDDDDIDDEPKQKTEDTDDSPSIDISPDQKQVQPPEVQDAPQEKPQESPTGIAAAPTEKEDQEEVDDVSDEQKEPEMHEVAPLEDMPSPEDEEEGITTVDLQEPSGNWLYKRIWWEKAEARYDKIKSAVNRILDSRMYFFEKRVKLDRSLFDPFYMSLGLTRGELQEAVSYLAEQLQVAADGGVEKVQKRSMINTLQAEQANVEQLQSNVETIKKIDHAVDDALSKLMNQINLARNYEQEGWQYLRSIAQELSDKAARDHYYAMDTLWKNVKNIQQYIDGEFSAHFDELVSEAQKQTESINQTINQLKEKGIDLKNMVQSMLEQEDADTEELDEEEEEPEPIGWFGWFVNILLWPFYKIADLWRSFFG